MVCRFTKDIFQKKKTTIQINKEKAIYAYMNHYRSINI